jgi:hypothetical protein
MTIGEPLQATPYIAAGLMLSLVTNIDYLEAFINYFHENVVNNNVQVMVNFDKLVFRFPQGMSFEEKRIITQRLESADSLILHRLGKIDGLVERAVSTGGEFLDDPDSSLSFLVNRIKTLQLKHNYA